MTDEQKILDIHNLLQAEYHLRNKGENGSPDHGYIGADPYLRKVSYDETLSERIKNIWQNESPEAACREVLRLALEISR